jgi:protein-L-isoaspartate O-methyltransferase
MTAATRGPETPYAFSNDLPTANDLLGALGQMLDPFTKTRLTEAGVAQGMRCLEVGAGAGTIAVWLAEQVGPTGAVVATDVRPQHIPAHPGLTAIKHNVVAEPLPAGPFDIIHARAVLQHLPERHEVLAKLTAALAPGGVVIIEELETGWSRAVLATPDPRAHEIFAHYEAALASIFKASGNDPTWARRVHTAMRDLDLTDVDTQGWQGSWSGGTGAALLAYSGSSELHDKLVESGMTAEELETLRRLAVDPRLVLRGILLLSTAGRKPA